MQCEEEWTAASIRNEVDGVITDEPKRFLELCDQWSSEEVRERALGATVKQTLPWLIINVLNSFGGLISWLVQGAPSRRIRSPTHPPQSKGVDYWQVAKGSAGNITAFGSTCRNNASLVWHPNYTSPFTHYAPVILHDA